MKNKESRKTFARIVAVFLGGMTIIFASFYFGGFPFPSEPVPQVAWLEVAFLLVLLGIPLFR